MEVVVDRYNALLDNNYLPGVVKMAHEMRKNGDMMVLGIDGDYAAVPTMEVIKLG